MFSSTSSRFVAPSPSPRQASYCHSSKQKDQADDPGYGLYEDEDHQLRARASVLGWECKFLEEEVGFVIDSYISAMKEELGFCILMCALRILQFVMIGHERAWLRFRCHAMSQLAELRLALSPLSQILSTWIWTTKQDRTRCS